MFVNIIAFLVSLSRGIRLHTCEHVPNLKAKQLSKSLRRIVNLYARGGFRVRTIMMDMEFEKVKDQEGMELVDVNTSAAREHVDEIERGIRYLSLTCMYRSEGVVNWVGGLISTTESVLTLVYWECSFR